MTVRAFVVAALIVTGCSDSTNEHAQHANEIRSLERRIDALEREGDRLRAEIHSLHAFDKDAVTKHNGLNDLFGRHQKENLTRLDAAERRLGIR